jgi:hypothetical protein
MDAACPAAWTFLAFEKFLYSSPDPPGTSLCLFCIFDPTDKFIAREKCPDPHTSGVRDSGSFMKLKNTALASAEVPIAVYQVLVDELAA